MPESEEFVEKEKNIGKRSAQFNLNEWQNFHKKKHGIAINCPYILLSVKIWEREGINSQNPGFLNITFVNGVLMHLSK